LKTAFNPFGVTGFVLSSSFAVAEKWSLPEFCWSTWLAGLVYAWVCVVTAGLQILLTARWEKPSYEKRFPFIRHVSYTAFLLAIFVVIVPVGVVAFYLYSYLFAFYGAFLSFFAEMEPHAFFGRNGFINSDFFSPVRYLIFLFWPMALGTLIANWEDFFRQNPWKRIFLPFQAEILRIHFFIVALPFLTLIAWALFGKAYQPVTIVLLMGLFYFLPRKTKRNEANIGENSE
jgi:hypothetical protein